METARKSDKLGWVGWGLTVLSMFPFIPSAFMKFQHSDELVKNWTKGGWPESLLTPLGIVEVACVALYLIPRTSVLGAILIAGYLGGAIATHLRVGEPIYIQSALGILAWGGLFLRDSRVRALIPFRTRQA